MCSLFIPYQYRSTNNLPGKLLGIGQCEWEILETMARIASAFMRILLF